MLSAVWDRRGWSEPNLAYRRSSFHRRQELVQIRLEQLPVVFVEVSEFERLQITLCCPHRKKHGRMGADRCRYVKNDLDFDAFIDRLRHMQQPPGRRQLMKLGGNLAAVLEPNQYQHGTCQFHPARPALRRLLIKRHRHSLLKLWQEPAVSGRLPKHWAKFSIARNPQLPASLQHIQPLFAEFT